MLSIVCIQLQALRFSTICWPEACLKATCWAYLREEVAIEADAGTAVVVQAPPVAALLVGVQVRTACLGCGVPHQLQPLVQLAQLPAHD